MIRNRWISCLLIAAFLLLGMTASLVAAPAAAAGAPGFARGSASAAKDRPVTGQIPVRAWEEPLVIPTYLVAPAEPNPIFFSGRAYQGAKGPVYPYPFLDRLTDTRVDKTYRAVYLENAYLKICVLPEIGGRIFSAVDKINGYDLVYRQHVIKPALIGMLGAWISGGVEWNIPHHHRATTFMDVDHAIVRNKDGSSTVWIGEIELRHRMKWLVGLTLFPDSSALDVTLKVFNRTALAHSVLAWANVAVHANPNYQVIFPPDVEFATFHGKNQFSRWPVATEVFNRQDYRTGVDVSWWKSHAAPTSFFAWDARGDFLAGYDHGKDAGIAFVADSHFVPGKKLWTWGTGAEGRLWEKILTEADGPYAELMIGAFSDNQPDYSWLQPYEARTVKQTWFPLRGIGGVKAASDEAALNLTFDPKGAHIGLHTNRSLQDVRLTLAAKGRVIFEDIVAAGPEQPYKKDMTLPTDIREDDLSLTCSAVDGRIIVSYAPPKKSNKPWPPVVTPPPAPKEIATAEELYLTGLRLEQLLNPAQEPTPYYEEALKRDSGDYRANTALGLLLLKRALYREAEDHFRRAVDRVTRNYIRPKDGEALYYLGVVLRAQGKADEAEDALYRASWSQGWRAASLYQLAELSALRGDPRRALDLVSASLELNALNSKALGLQAGLWRKSKNAGDAKSAADRALGFDPLDARALNELYLIKTSDGLQEDVGQVVERLRGVMGTAEPNSLELAADYAAAGFTDEAIGVLDRFLNGVRPDLRAFPLIQYFLAWAWDQKGKSAKAAEALARAAVLPPDYVFPFQSECLDILAWAQSRNPKDARAPHYLGNYLFDLQPARAMEEWTKAVALDGSFSVALRNLGLAAARVKNDLPRALELYERALRANPNDPKLYGEFDILAEAARVPKAKRLARLEKNHKIVALRDDSLTREILLLVQTGRYDRAIDLLLSHHFHLWEGGGEIYSVFVEAHLLRGQKNLDDRKFKAALKDFETALTYPANLEVSERAGGEGSAKTFYLIGAAHEALNTAAKARAAFETAASLKPPWSEQSYYQALALRKLARDAEATALLDGLRQFAAARLKDAPSLDFFEKFGETQSVRIRNSQTHYLLGLGLWGLGRAAEAKAEFKTALELNESLTVPAGMLK